MYRSPVALGDFTGEAARMDEGNWDQGDDGQEVDEGDPQWLPHAPTRRSSMPRAADASVTDNARFTALCAGRRGHVHGTHHT